MKSLLLILTTIFIVVSCHLVCAFIFGSQTRHLRGAFDRLDQVSSAGSDAIVPAVYCYRPAVLYVIGTRFVGTKIAPSHSAGNPRMFSRTSGIVIPPRMPLIDAFARSP